MLKTKQKEFEKNPLKPKKKKQAFTLVELIVTITILAILATIWFVALQSYTKNARDWQRIADLNSIKKSLELFIIEKWFYPTPDTPVWITYSWSLAWTQWTLWDTVTRNLEKLNKKPTDPLTQNEYTYSLTNLKNEYQLSAIVEWWWGLLSSTVIPAKAGIYKSVNTQLFTSSFPQFIIPETYAATTQKAIAMVTWTYNEKILRVQSWTTDYILAIPSIINSDITDTDLLEIINKKQLVYNNYTNLPDSYKNKWYTMTGWFDFTPNNLVVYSWSTQDLKQDTNKLIFIENLKQAYESTILKSQWTYNDVINTDITNNQTQAINLVNNYINNNIWWIWWWAIIQNEIINEIEQEENTCNTITPICSPTWCTLTTWTPTIPNQSWIKDETNCGFTCNANYTWANCETYTPSTFLSNCTANWQIIYTDASWTEIWRVNNAWTTTSWNPWSLTCSWHIVMCTWNNTWYVLQACNLWASTVWATNNSSAYGNVYQWWRNKAFPSSWTVTQESTKIPWSVWLDAWTDTYWFVSWIGSPYSWANTSITDNWWHTTNTNIARQWPCPTNYHIPSQPEWSEIVVAWWWWSNWTNLSNALKLPFSGSRYRYNASLSSQGTRGYYWASSPYSYYFSYLSFRSSSVGMSNSAFWAEGYYLRCIKN